ncbi:MarR family winged helix-turn-helix transcriptional regulator [Chitinophaga lutea]
MTQLTLDEKLAIVAAGRNRSLIRLLSIVKKDLDARLTEKMLQMGYDFRIGDMVLLVNISPEGTINNELAKKARITKQAMSKVVKNLESAGYINTRKHETDNRATVIFLSDKGKQLVLDASACIQEIQQYYTSIIGESDVEVLRDILFRLVAEIFPQASAK